MPDPTLRTVRSEDESLLLEWANDGVVRANAFSTAPIEPQDHRRWFGAKLADRQCRIFIMEDDGGRPVAQIRFDLNGDEAEVDVSVAATARGRGFGAEIIRMGARKLFDETAVQRLVALVKRENIASMKAFLMAGFAVSEEIVRDGGTVSRLTLSRVA